jgi:hypothetical protein
MTLAFRFPSENIVTDHPDDARHWATTYAQVLRTLPSELSGTEIAAILAQQLESWEERLRTLLAEAPQLVSRYHRGPAPVRALPRPR